MAPGSRHGSGLERAGVELTSSNVRSFGPRGMIKQLAPTGASGDVMMADTEAVSVHILGTVVSGWLSGACTYYLVHTLSR